MERIKHIAIDPAEFKPERGMGEFWDGGSNRKARRREAAIERASRRAKAKVSAS